MGKALVIINEQHQLLPDQERVLLERFESFERVNVPAEGWTLPEIREQAQRLWAGANGKAIVFASPVPALLAILVRWDGQMQGAHAMTEQSVFVLHNDRRDKKELPGGRVIMAIAAEGWQLV